jgi:RNA polymerase sigma-70 factor (ECF subfamily)
MVNTLEDLAQRAGGGDALAYRRLVELASPPLYSLARQLLSDAAEAEDATQEALLRAYVALPRFVPRGEGSCLAWLRRIVINICRDWLRRRRGHPAPLSGELAELVPATVREHEGLDDSLLMAVRKLPRPYREVVILRYGQDLGYAEIARIVGTNERTVATRLRRALSRLRVGLAEEGIASEEAQLARD